MRRLLAVCGVLWLASACLGGAPRPVGVVAAPEAHLDARYNPAVTQANVASTICKSGYSASIRPPQSYTAPIKRAEIAALPASASHNPADYELDHLVPLEGGGNPTAPANLVLQLWAGPAGAHAKDAVEDRVHREICSGKITLAVGRRCFVVDWTGCP